jgi:hypothetical protein
VTTQEVEEIKRYFDEAVQGLRGDVTDLRGEMAAEFAQVRGEMGAGFARADAELSSFRRESAEVADYLMEQITDARREAVAHAEELRSQIQTVAEGVVLANERLDALTSDTPRRTPPPRRH